MPTKDEQIELLKSVLIRNSELLTRAALSERLGNLDPKRDMYKVLGYKKSPTFQDYLNIYERDGIAAAVVDIISDETWREQPFLLNEGQERDDARDNPGELQTSFSDLARRLELFSHFSDLDAALGCSRFALLFLGLSGETDLAQPATGGELVYVNVYDEGQITIKKEDLSTDPANERFGLPNFYWIGMDETNLKNKTKVHWSRVIHVKEGRGRSRLYGVPRLKNVLNRLQDLEKVVGSSSEAFWLLVYQGLVVTSKDDYALPDPGSPERKKIEDDLEEFVNGLRRHIFLEGSEVDQKGGQAISGKEQFDMLISYIAGSKSIPQRRLLGSERGNLASTQDDADFADTIIARQKKFAEPKILRVFLTRMGELRILNVPEKYEMEWPSLFSLNELEKADLASKVGGAMSSASGGAPELIMPGHVFAQRYLDYTAEPEDRIDPLTGEDITEKDEPEPIEEIEPEIDPLTRLPKQPGQNVNA